jgi:hypothetical protein
MPFQKKIAPTTPVEADLGGPPGVSPAVSKGGSSKKFGKKNPSKGGGFFQKGGGVKNFRGGRR